MQWNKTEYSGWGRVQRVSANIARPERHAALGAMIADCDQILPVGNLRSYGDAALVDDGNALRTVRLDRLIDFDPETGVLEAEPGITLGEILRVFAPRGWMPAVLPGTGMTTLGGAIANDVHGKNHHGVGSFGQHVESLMLMTADGKARKIGPDLEPELFKATVGGVGQTGVITSARIQLAPCPSTTVRVSERRIRDLEEYLDVMDRSTSPFQVGWIDALARGNMLGRGVFEEADFNPAEHEPIPDKPAKSMPPVPGALGVHPTVVRMFNSLYWRRVSARGRTATRALGKFFFPLDKVSDWNRVYGKAGFYQFQCVIPFHDAQNTLRALLDMVAAAGIASPLAVLKRLGPGRAGYLSFPTEGYTLAIDLPNRDGVQPLLQGLEDVMLAAGGRVYLAKDGHVSKAAMPAMYPDLPAFQDVIRRVDPDAKFASAMTKRLNLRGDQ